MDLMIETINAETELQASRLFSPDSSVDFVGKAFGGEVSSRTLDSPSAWLQVLETQSAQNTEHIYFIQQKHSWSRLLITYDLLRQLLSHYVVFPSFWREIYSFGARTTAPGSLSEPFFRDCGSLAPAGGAPSSEPGRGSGYELHYNLLYVEKHGRDLSSPWAVRHMSVYQQARFDQGFSVWIIIHASASVQRKFSSNVPLDEGLGSGVMLEIKTLIGHMVIVSAAVVNWGSYIDSLSEEFAHRNDRAQMSKIVKIDASDDDSFETNLQDMQWLQWFAQHLFELRGHLRDNLATLAAVRKLGNRFSAAEQPADQQSQNALIKACNTFCDWMIVWTHAFAQHLRDTEMLIFQSQGCAELVYNILKSKETEILQVNGALLNAMTERTRADNFFSLDLSIKSHRAARSMRTITILTLVYVPPSFLATFFGMNFFQMTPSSNTLSNTIPTSSTTTPSLQHPHLLLTPQLWMYAATAMPLTALTFALWWIWDRRAEREDRGLKRAAEGEKKGEKEK